MSTGALHERISAPHEVRRRERALTEQAEVAYRQLVAGWQPKRPATKPQ